ncbi:MAG: T9SS type A sorting domain-containing protein, partial [Flavobacteriaceae bacterium]
LTPYALIPNLFTEENDDLHYMYLYKEQSSDGPIFNNLVFSKGLDDILVEFRGDTSAGNIVGSTFLTDGNGTFDKMTIQYESPNDALITDFYRLPFTTTLGTEDLENIQFAFYPNPTDGQVKIDASEPVKFIQVFNINGQSVYNHAMGSTQMLDLSALASGIYFAHITFDNGTNQKIKFIKK